MKRTVQRGLLPGIVACLSVVFVVASCAPTPAPPATTTSTTTTTVLDTVPDCTPGAVGTLSLGENPVAVPPGFTINVNNIEICWNFGAAGANRAVFIEQCWAPASTPGFNVSINCYKGGEDNVNPQSNPGSSKKEFRVFRGPEQSGDSDWGCFAPGDVAPPGITKYTTCYIRVTLDSFSNNADHLSIPFTLAN